MPREAANALSKELVRVVDDMVTHALEICLQSSDFSCTDGVALCTVGSYGHGLPSLYSDVDLRLLVEGVSREKKEQLASCLFKTLRNCGVPVSMQASSIDALVDFATTDITSATSLLDIRHVSGSRKLTEQLKDISHETLFQKTAAHHLLRTLEDQARERHKRFDRSMYLLEPDIKQGRGGLRDIDLIRWGIRLRNLADDVPAEQRDDASRWLLPEEERDIATGTTHLIQLRNLLHSLSGRRCDRLAFQQQERIASLLVERKTDTATVEQFMKAHFQIRRQVANIRETVLGLPSKSSARTNPKEVAQTILANPAWPLQTYKDILANNSRASARMRVAVRRALSLPACAAAVENSKLARQTFVDLCANYSPNNLLGGSVLRELHDAGLLACLIPEMKPLIGQTHHDVYHVLTVDAHSIAAVDKLHMLVRGEGGPSDAFAIETAQRIEDIRMLSLATLLHDVGKGRPREDHTVVGAKMAFDISHRLGLSPDAAKRVRSLVKNHLELYHFATRRDMSSPHVLQGIADIVVDERGLLDLWLLTYADVSTTSPNTMNAWKASLLQQLYVSASRWLHSHSQTGASTASPDQDTLSRLPQDLREVFASMPLRYRRSMNVNRATRHMAFIEQISPSSTRVSVLESDVPDTAEVAVMTTDSPGLLARLAFVLARRRLSVLEASINSRPGPDGHADAIDFFVVRGAMVRTQGRRKTLEQQLSQDVHQILNLPTIADEQVFTSQSEALASQVIPPIRARARMHRSGESGLAIVETFTSDRPGLLYDLAKSLHALGLQIDFAKISTEGAKVSDVFYVRELDNQDIFAPKRHDEIIDTMLRVLQTDPSID